MNTGIPSNGKGVRVSARSAVPHAFMTGVSVTRLTEFFVTLAATVRVSNTEKQTGHNTSICTDCRHSGACFYLEEFRGEVLLPTWLMPPPARGGSPISRGF